MSQTYQAGRYRGRMTSVSMGVSAEKGTPEIRFNFDVVGRHGPNGLEACDPDSRTIFKYVTDATIDYLIQDLSALGFDRESFDQIDSDNPDAFPWAGIEFDCKVSLEEYKGKSRERWEFSRGVSKGKPIEAKTVRELDAKYGAYLKPGNRPKQQQPAAASAPNGSADEGIPF